MTAVLAQAPAHAEAVVGPALFFNVLGLPQHVVPWLVVFCAAFVFALVASARFRAYFHDLVHGKPAVPAAPAPAPAQPVAAAVYVGQPSPLVPRPGLAALVVANTEDITDSILEMRQALRIKAQKTADRQEVEALLVPAPAEGDDAPAPKPARGRKAT